MCKLIPVKTGGMSESVYRTETVELMIQEKLGDYTVLFAGPWLPEKLAEVAAECRRSGFRFAMDETVNRLNGKITPKYAPHIEEISKILKSYSDVCDGSLLMCEFGGLMFYWPQSTVANASSLPPPSVDYQEASDKIIAQMRQAIALAEKHALPRPYICIEAAGTAASFIYRAGIDRVDFEVTYDRHLELSYSCVKGATIAFGKNSFGVDMAMVWYGGNQHDELWRQRWRTSLLHAFIRGADPIYAEHGIMDYKALGKNYDTTHPDVRSFRQPLTDLAQITRKHPRPAGFPLARLAVVHGRLDGFTGLGQTHQWGQRLNDDFLLNDADRSWELFEQFYRRRPWQDRDPHCDRDYSGNPPLGQLDVIPFDAPQEIFNRYEALIFLGRNSMDDTLYHKLTTYTAQGGELLICAAHMDTAIKPNQPFTPYNNGDWHELCGVKTGTQTRLPYGLKFIADPSGTRWRLPLWSENCDPKFSDGGFDMFELEFSGAQTLALDSDRFVGIGSKPAVISNQVGSGCVIMVNSFAFPGSPAMRNLYSLLLHTCAEAHQHGLLIEAGDRVRYALYPHNEGYILYVLNTEGYLTQEAIINRNSISIQPGELKIITMDRNYAISSII